MLTLRNLMVAPFGLKGRARRTEADAPSLIGIFPVVSETRERLVAGFNDRHLDFRVVVDIQRLPARAEGPERHRDHAGADA